MGARTPDRRVLYTVVIALSDGGTQLRLAVQHAAQRAGTACQQAPIEQADLLRAVRGRTSRGFLRPPPREVLAQQASEQNVLPMPLMPRRATVRLPPPDECAAAGRHDVSHDEQELCWWQDATRA